MAAPAADDFSIRTPSIESDSTDRPGKRILALDYEFSQRAGALGIFGLISYLMSSIFLREQDSARVEGRQPKLTELPRPCECFDLIGGSGHGGFIALLLGCIGLSVDAAKEAYLNIHRFILSNHSSPTLKKDLKREVIKMLESHEVDRWKLFVGTDKGPCKTFVTGAYVQTADTPLRLRTYHSRAQDNRSEMQKLLLWEVLCMMLVDDPPRRDAFRPERDSMFRRHPTCLNPSNVIARESLDLWPFGRLASFWSLGCGKCLESRDEESLRSQVSEDLEERSGLRLDKNSRTYFRLEATFPKEYDTKGLPTDYELFVGEITATTRNYMDSNSIRLEVDVATASLLEPKYYRGVTLARLNGLPDEQLSSFGGPSESDIGSPVPSNQGSGGDNSLKIDEMKEILVTWTYEDIKLGYPLWEPRVHNYNKPVELGDVGYLAEDGAFHILFNAMIPAAEQEEKFTLPPNFNHYRVSPKDIQRFCTSAERYQHTTKGSPIEMIDAYEGSGAFGLQFNQAERFDLDIHSGPSGNLSPEIDGRGLALICTDDFWTIEINDHQGKLKEYIKANARIWYKFYKQRHDCEILVITTVHLQEAWARATFSQPPPPGSARYTGTTRQGINNTSALDGQWAPRRGKSVSLRLDSQVRFPTSHESRLRKDDVGGVDGPTQALFIKGQRVRRRGGTEALGPSFPPPDSRFKKTGQDILYWVKRPFTSIA